MQAADHLPSRMGTLYDMMATSTGFYHSDVPRCPPPCECADCQDSYYRLEEQQIDRFCYTSTRTDAEARAILADLTNEIHEAQHYLQRAIHLHGDHILSRWRKRTQPKRAALLQQAEPDLPEKKGFAADLEYDEDLTWHVTRQAKHRKYYLLPYLDVDTLVRNPSTLIGLIHTRAKESAEAWAPFDHEQLRSSWGMGLLDAEFNAGVVIMFGPKYGTLSKWEEKTAHRFDVVGFPRARLILEAQATLLRFLRRVVEQILEGLPQTEPVSTAKWDDLIRSGLKMTGNTACWSTFVNQPFTAPLRFDIDVLVAQTRARYEATSDHLWLLQTEPSYLKRYMRKISQMQTVELTGRTKIGLVVINGEIIGDIDMNWFWRCALSEFENIQDLYRRYRDSIVPGAPLPRKVDNALGALEIVLVNQVHTRCKQLDAIISQRPGFRTIYESAPITESVSDTKNMYETTIKLKEQFRGKAKTTLAYRTERLWWILVQLLGPPDSQTRFRYAMVLGLLEDHLANSPAAERGRLDAILYEKMSDYLTLIELLWAVRMHRPRNRNRTVKECEATEDRLFWRTSVSRHSVPSSNPRAMNVNDMIGALRAFQATMPPSGPRNRDWLERFQALHTTLQDYWLKTSDLYRERYKKNGLKGDDIEVSMHTLLFWKNPTHTAQLETKVEQILADTRKAKTPDSEDVFLPLPAAGDESVKLDNQPSKTKAKTRGELRPEDPVLDAETVPVQKSDLANIALPKRAYATFRYMFPTSPEERQKHVEWDTFVNSMADAGFTARNGGGSIVTFEDQSGGGKIIFHRPHPEPSIDPVMLQSMGRRLNKWFGWTREIFVLAGK